MEKAHGQFSSVLNVVYRSGGVSLWVGKSCREDSCGVNDDRAFR